MSRLTPREREVITLVAAGKTAKEIGMILKCSHRTVEKHRASAMQKLGINTVAGIAIYVNCYLCKKDN